MERILEKTSQKIADENEKVIANIIHDIKSPLYSIKIALQNKLNIELNRDIYETVICMIKYIEDFLADYNFKSGKFKNKIKPCNIKEIINKKIECYKYLFINKNVKINIIDEINKYYCLNSIEIFLSSIIGNIISNIAFHSVNNNEANIKLQQKNNSVIINFQNYFANTCENFSLGLEFCKKLSKSINAKISFDKTKDSINVCLEIPDLKI